MHRTVRPLLVVVALCLVAVACSAEDTSRATNGCFDSPNVAPIDLDVRDDPDTLTLLAHDSFVVSPDVLDAFTAETGIDVEIVLGGDGGTLVNQAVLAGDNPAGDVLFGIDNTFLCVGLENDIFLPHLSERLSAVPDELEIDPHNRVTPIDYGDVCANFWVDEFAPGDAPASLDDLIDARFADQFVTQNPESSTPGLAFLLATIARYGEEGWQDYWRSLFANGVVVTEDWESAYSEVFRAGGGDRAIVNSYASSPVAEVLFADPPIDTPPTAVVTDGCYRQIEFAGVLRGTDHPAAAARLVDFLLSDTFQEDIPLNMFVFPASTEAALPELFSAHAELVEDALTLDAALVAERRNQWTEEWTALRRE